ncbi:alginate export family protein [Altericroceibacterium spongiae]|nr:alginate export family protein [Altericroceibacterium spongiae]
MTTSLPRWGRAGCCILAVSVAMPAFAQSNTPASGADNLATPDIRGSASGDSPVDPLVTTPASVQETDSTAQEQEAKAPSITREPEAGVVDDTAPRNIGTPPGPYPVEGQGWGPKTGRNFYMIRYAEDWSYLADPKAEDVPLRNLKYIPLGTGDGAYLTLNGYERIRYVYSSRPYMDEARSRDRHEIQTRTMFGADAHLNENFRVYAEIGNMETFGRNQEAHIGVHEDNLNLQQLFAEARFPVAGGGKAGVMIGRQQFYDGSRVILSTREGPNVPLSMNGVRLWSQWDKFRFSAFALYGSEDDTSVLGDGVDTDVSLSGVNTSFVVANGDVAGQDSQVFFDPFFFHYLDKDHTIGLVSGRDRRETYGARLWGHVGRFQFDWSAIQQDGDFAGRPVDAYTISAEQSLALASGRDAPRIGLHAEIASGGGYYTQTGPIHSFNPINGANILFTEINTLTGINLAKLGPNITFNPVKNVNIFAEAGFYWRRDENEPLYRTSFEPYAGTENVKGKEAMQIYRARMRWTINQNVSVVQQVEYVAAGKVLDRAGFKDEIYAATELHLRF